MEIELKYNRTDFEEILFSNHSDNYFRSPYTKKPFQHLIICIVIFSILLLLSNEANFPIMLVVFGSFLIYYLIWYLINANKVRLRRKNVKLYLDKTETYGQMKLIVEVDGFQLLLDDETYSEKWKDIVKKEIHDLYVYLVSEIETYFIPKKSMTDEQFTILLERVKAIN